MVVAYHPCIRIFLFNASKIIAGFTLLFIIIQTLPDIIQKGLSALFFSKGLDSQGSNMRPEYSA